MARRDDVRDTQRGRLGSTARRTVPPDHVLVPGTGTWPFGTVNGSEELRQGLRADAGGERLAVPPRPAQARPAEPAPDAALRAERDRRPRDRRRRRGRADARAAARARRLADRR